jgi:hypothetical protein
VILRVENTDPRSDGLLVTVSLVDDSNPDAPQALATEDFVFDAKRSPEQCAMEIQRRFDDRQRDMKGLQRLQEAFPQGKQLPIVTGAQARSVLGV